MRCASCGYGAEYHDQMAHCPLCACGKLPGEHLPVLDPPAPLVAESRKLLAVCPSKPLTAAGKLPTLRRGTFREAPPAESLRALPALPPQPEVEPDDITRRRAAEAGLPAAPTHPDPSYVAFPLAWQPEALSEPVRPPRVPARYTTSLDEIAPRAMPVGRVASDLGWRVDPWYWQAADGTETSALTMSRDELRCVAYWNRAPGRTWKTGGASAWRIGSFPSPVSVTRLVEFIEAMG